MTDKYREAGVDIDAASESVSRLGPLVERTKRAGVMGALGGFGGLFSLKGAGFASGDGDDETILVSGADGVGTKLKLAIELGRHDTIGIDLVAMCTNDVLTTGATPLFFLDYISTGHLDPGHIESLVEGIARGCERSGCALIGGETAEMPGLYDAGDYDLAGFCVGAVRRGDLLNPVDHITPGAQLLACASSGIHSNGYSLVRKIKRDAGWRLDEPFEGRTLGEALLEPTRHYLPVLEWFASEARVTLSGLAHITGGGLTENVPRMLGEGCAAVLDVSTWEAGPLFERLLKDGGLSQREAMRIFNMGVGMVCAVESDAVEADEAANQMSEALGYDVWRIGEVVARQGKDTPRVKYVGWKESS